MQFQELIHHFRKVEMKSLDAVTFRIFYSEILMKI